MQKLVREYLNEWKSKKRKRRRIGIAVTLLVVMVAGTVIGALTQYGIAMTGDMNCGLEEHTHSEACYEDTLICGQEESEGHMHGDGCYDAEGTLICGQEEKEGHLHKESCYEPRLICDMEEHIHTDSCYINTDADVEEASLWDEQYASVEWKGAWGEDLVTAARMQTGYKESTQNYGISEDGSHKGYTRYGQFAGDVYADWDAAFVNFCLYYAGLTDTGLGVFPDSPGETDTIRWRETFGNVREGNSDFLTGPEGYEPEAGDIIFFQRENEETAEQMGIVSSYNKEENRIQVIEGNSGNEVKENTYDAGDSCITGYLKLTELEAAYKNPNGEESEEPTADNVNTTGDGSEQEAEAGTETKAEGQTTIEGIEQESEGQTPGADTEPGAEEQAPEADAESGAEGQDSETDYVACTKMAALDDLQENEAGSALENYSRADIQTDNSEGGLADSSADSGWSFDAYYVNQDDRSDVLKTSDFNLKYQMEFHTSRNFKAGEIAVRVERMLFDLRNGDPVNPDQIAVPQVGKEGDKEVPVENRNMPFNYRIITDDEGTEYLEFFNYKEIPAGSNVAWQVLYKNLKIMKITDEQEWTLHPEIIIWDTDKDGNPVYGTEKVKKTAAALKGQTDSSVRLNSVAKKEYHAQGKQYTPELYTASQVRAYTENISEENEKLFFRTDENGKEILNDEYYYAVWQVTMKGTASQPWKVLIQETPGAEGRVVGYKDDYDVNKGFDVQIDSGKALTDGVAIEQNERTSWSSRFYVVTAYPAANVTPDETDIANEIEIRAVPCDGRDEMAVRKAEAEFTYKKFTWTYSSDGIGMEKKSIDKEDYSGWLEVYSRVKDDYGDIGFTSKGEFRGYGLTHEVTGEKLGQYKEGTSYKLITADDFMYAVNGKDYTMLGKEDYYYSGVTITQKEQGYDIWEDAITSQPEENGDTGEQGVRIYAKFAEGNDDSWQEITYVPWNDSGVMTYTFSPNDLARKPYRVKAEHIATNYRTTCEIQVKVRIRKDSPVMAKIMKSYKAGELSAISFEDLSGVIGQNRTSEDGDWKLTPVELIEDVECNYDEPDLLEETKKLYDELKDADTGDKVNFPMYRDNAYKKVTGLEAHAASYKALTGLTNDVTNRRGQVVYSLTAQDGYEMFSQEAVTELKRQGMPSPGRQDVVFYDLLPEGMTFDPSYQIRAGRITNFDSRGNYKKQPGLWDSGQTEVTWETRDNYNGTSRTMVIFHIRYTGEDAAVYNNRSWQEGWGVSFRAYYDWEDTKLVEKGTNICAFMPDTTDPRYGEPLCGTDAEVAMDDGVIVPEDYKDVYRDFGANIDGNPANDTIRNVLYAENDESEDIAQSYNSAVTKLVRADADKYSSYRDSAVVEENGFYTYDIKVTTGNNALKNLIVYDHLENAAADRATASTDPNAGFAEAGWRGTLQAVLTSGLNKLGVAPVVYYSADRNAPMPGNTSELEKIDGSLENVIDNAGNRVWYTEEEFKALQESGGSLEAAKSVAVDLRKKADGSDFVLEAESSVSFRIQMRAPEIKDDNSGYAYNSPIYYSAAEDIDNGLRYGDSVKVSRKKAASLEVIKEFGAGANVPDSVKDTAFEFCLTDKRDGESKAKAFSYQVYKLYKKDAEGRWKKDSEAGQYATDGNGLLELQADEKAVFEKIPDAERIEVKETENIFWKSEVKETEAEAPDYVRTVTVTNTYRPVLYIQKKLEGVPEEMDIEEVNPEFTFRVQAEQEGELKPLANQEYYYVREARTDGGMPRIDTAKGTDGKGTTGEDGTFAIHPGEIIAVFPGDAGTRYEVTEIENAASSEDWICREDTVTGKIPVGGASAAIRNYYRWRDLYLTKRITHDNGRCDEEFTFQIQKVKKGNGTEELIPLTQEEIRRLDLRLGYLWDGEFQEVYGSVAGGSTGGLLRMSRGLSIIGNGNGTQLPGMTDSTGSRITVNMDGTFRCRCAGMTIRIRNLEAGETYRITEIVSEGSLYLPEEDTKDVTMPLYGGQREVTFTNDYQMRPLTISKKVVSSKGEVNDNTEFTMQILVNGEPLAGHPYIIQDSGESGDAPRLPGIEASEERAAVGTLEIPETDAEGKIHLKDGQTAILPEAGKLGDEFTVIEETAEGYRQIAPSGNGEGTFAGEGGEVVFVNAKDDEGTNLYISKIYEANQESSGWLWKANSYVDELKEANRTEGASETEKGSVEVTLTVNGETFTGGENGQTVTVVNQLTGETTKKIWNGPTFMLDPWTVVIIPVDAKEGSVSYTLSESKEDQHRIVEYRDAEGIWMTQGSWLEISQKEPKNDRPAEGTVAENPVATITNEVTEVGTSSLVTKQMTEDSSPVPEGAELVWRVEQFNGVSWQPAEGVSYITLAGDWSKDAAGAGVVPTCDRILQTGPDGRIVLRKEEWEDGIDRQPAVYFADVLVSVNRYDEAGRYRVIEVMEESDEDWGMLKEYTAGWYYEKGNDDGLNLSYGRAGGFVNSNENAPIEIAKAMEEDSDETFTMILKQVLSVKPDADFGDIGEGWEENITASEGRSGIPYTVYDTATGEPVAEKETGKNGEIYLKAGQYARLNLSNTLWTVSEETGYTYKLKSLTPESEKKLKRLNDNLMLINGDFPPTYKVVYKDSSPNNPIEPQIFTGLKEGDATPKVPDPTKADYIFMGWAPGVNPVVSAEDAKDGQIIYEATWRKPRMYTVIYTDGVPGEIVFPDEGQEGLQEGTKTPEYEGTPERNGYIFIGWDPEWQPVLAGEKEEIVYTAKWAKEQCKITYCIDGSSGSGPIMTAPYDSDHKIKDPATMPSWEFPSDKKFLGWAEIPNASIGDVVYEAGDTVTVKEDLILYAVVEPK